MTKKGARYLFVYEQGYLKLDNDQYMLVHKQDYVKWSFHFEIYVVMIVVQSINQVC